MRSHRISVLAALLLSAVTAAAVAQPAPTPSPGPPQRSNADAPAAPRSQPTPRAPGERTFTFQLVLLAADTQGATRFENVPANAQKALDDVKGFLPYTSYKLLDLAWIRCSRTAEAQVSGPDGRSFTASLRFVSDESDPNRIDIQRLVIMEPTPQALTTPQPLHPLLETSFGMKAGETVVVGTARLDGPAKALVVLLSALP
jgi:hypothetical protein